MVRYQTVIKEIGHLALDFLKEEMIIFFKEGSPVELAEISLIHSPMELFEEIEVEDVFFIEKEAYKVTAVGNVANKNLKTMGHFILKFDGKTKAELPGNIHVENKECPSFSIGDRVVIKAKECSTC